jgi:hypothetical protein
MRSSASVTGRLGRRPGRRSAVGWWFPASGLLAGLVVLGGSAAAGAQTLTWPVVSSLSPSGHNSYLGSVSCVPSAGCTAAGDQIASGPLAADPDVTGTAPEPSDPGVVQTGGDPAPTDPGVVQTGGDPAPPG